MVTLIVGILIGSALLSYWGTRISLRVAKTFNITDDPASNPSRKHQRMPIPLLGGTGFVLYSMFAMSLIWLWYKSGSEILTGLPLEPFRLIWILISISILLVGGYLDDKYHLSPKIMMIPIFIAVSITVVLAEVSITALSYPFNNFIPQYPGLGYILAIVWIGLCLGATKFLDGHDGLVGSIGLLGFLTIASVSMFSSVNQPLVSIFAIIWAGSMVGFLPFNFPDAKGYLGEGGSEIIGFMIGVLSILSGAKVATASMVIGWFILDFLIVMLWRILHKKSPFSGDRLHWHFRLYDLGLSKVQTLVLTVIIIQATALMGLYVPTEKKLWVLVSQIVLLLCVFGVSIYLLSRKSPSNNPKSK